MTRRLDPFVPFPDTAEAFIRTIVKPDQPLRAPQVGRLLGVHENTVKRIPASELPYFTVSPRGDRRYFSSDVHRYIEARMVRL